MSDLHIGGEGVFAHCDFEKELIDFLNSLTDKNTELILVGDTFGLWEVYTIKGHRKLDFIINQHKKIFEAFKEVGKRIKITLIPGNHDHELAAYPQMKKLLKKYNMNLQQTVHITRKIGKKYMWIEHGNQQDRYNYIANWKDPHAKPVGYYFNHTIIKQTVENAKKIPWLRNVLAINSPKEIPNWFFSSYFYKEMHPILRYVTTPILTFAFLAFIFIAWYAVLFAGRFVERLFTKTTFLATDFSSYFGMAGKVWEFTLLASGFSLAVFLLFSLPLGLILYDVRKAFSQFGLKNKDDKHLVKEAPYDIYAKKIFKKHKKVCMYIYGHTHRASIKHIGKNLIINTGTWLKILRKRKTKLRLFPAVYEPSFRLNYLTVEEGKENIIVQYKTIDKIPEDDQKFIEKIIPKRHLDRIQIPKTTLIPK